MLREITSEQFGEWIAFCDVEPFGSEVESFRSAQVVAAVVNSSMKFKRSDYPVSDFMPKRARPSKPTLGERIRAAFSKLGAVEEKSNG